MAQYIGFLQRLSPNPAENLLAGQKDIREPPALATQRSKNATLDQETALEKQLNNNMRRCCISGNWDRNPLF
jgi:hypothetical protein